MLENTNRCALSSETSTFESIGLSGAARGSITRNVRSRPVENHHIKLCPGGSRSIRDLSFARSMTLGCLRTGIRRPCNIGKCGDKSEKETRSSPIVLEVTKRANSSTRRRAQPNPRVHRRADPNAKRSSVSDIGTTRARLPDAMCWRLSNVALSAAVCIALISFRRFISS